MYVTACTACLTTAAKAQQLIGVTSIVLSRIKGLELVTCCGEHFINLRLEIFKKIHIQGYFIPVGHTDLSSRATNPHLK